MRLQAFNILYDDTLFLIFHIRWNHIIYLSDNKLALIIILRCIYLIKRMNIPLNTAHLSHISIFKKFIDGIRHSSHEQIDFKLLEHIVMHRLIQGFLIQKTLSHALYSLLSTTHRPQKFLEIKRIHLLDSDTANRHRRGLRQGDTQLGATCHISVFTILVEKLKHGHQVRITLYFIKKHQCIILTSEIVTSHSPQLQVKVFLAPYRFKDAIPLLVCLEIYLNKMLEKFLSYISYQIRFSYLPCTIDKQNFPRFMKKNFLQIFSKFTF